MMSSAQAAGGERKLLSYASAFTSGGQDGDERAASDVIVRLDDTGPGLLTSPVTLYGCPASNSFGLKLQSPPPL